MGLKHIITWSIYFLLILQFPFGVADRDIRTAPPGFSVRRSSIPDAGNGTFADTFVAKNTWLGEYEGVIIPRSSMTSTTDDTYMWRVYILKLIANLNFFLFNYNSHSFVKLE